MIKMKGKYLITTDNFFFGPDGKQYRAAWGEVQIMAAKDALGFDPNRNSANWYVKVGTEESHVLIAGCQIHFSVKCENMPNDGRVEESFEGKQQVNNSKIFIAEAIEEKIKPPALEIPRQRTLHEYETLIIKAISKLNTGYFNDEEAKMEIIKRIENEGIQDYRFIENKIELVRYLEIIWNEGEGKRYSY